MKEVYVLSVSSESGDNHLAHRVFSERLSDKTLLEIVAKDFPFDFINEKTGAEFNPQKDDIHSGEFEHYAYYELIGPVQVE